MHALEQIRERGLSEEIVRDAVEEPEQVLPEGSRQIAQRRSGRYLVRVVYEEIDDSIVVVTVYKTSKLEKYWRP